MPGKLTANLLTFGAALTFFAFAPALRASAEISNLDDLRRLVPANAIAVLETERLAHRLRDVQSSPLVVGLSKLPMVEAWFKSEEGRRFTEDRARAEKAIGSALPELQERLLNQAALAAVFPPSRPGQPAPILILAVADDRAWLEERINAIRRSGRAGERWNSRQRGGVTYEVRAEADAFAILGEATFTWSNSIEILEAAIDRLPSSAKRDVANASLAGSRFSDDPKREAMTKRLNPQAIARFYLNPRALSATLGMPEGWSARASALDYLGGSLDWRNGPILQVEASLNPQRLPPETRRWAHRIRESSLDPILEKKPATALIVCAAKLDFVSALDLAMKAFDPQTQERGENLLQALRGLMLDQDPREELLPKLGPAAVLTLEPSDPPRAEGFPLSWTAILAADDRDGRLAKGLENAARTAAALAALDPNHPKAALPQLDSKTLDGVKIAEWTVPDFSLSFGFSADRLVFSNRSMAAAQIFQPQAAPSEGHRLAECRNAFFRDADAFLFVDLIAGREWLESRRADLVPPDDPKAVEDFEQSMSLIRLFRAAFASARIAPDASEAGLTIGLIGRD